MLSALVVVSLAGCSVGGSEEQSGDPVATVGTRTITEGDVEHALEHFREEAKREGKGFPEEGTPAFASSRRHVIGRLVYRAQIEQGAERLGVRVSDEQVERELEQARESEGEEGDAEGGESEDFLRDTVRSQLAYVAAYRKVTGSVRVGGAEIRAYYRRNRARFGNRTYAAVRPVATAELLQLRRSRAMDAWVKETRREFPPRYQSGERRGGAY